MFQKKFFFRGHLIELFYKHHGNVLLNVLLTFWNN